MQKRLREARGEETERETKGPAASADAVTELGSRLSLFISGEFEGLDRDVTTFEDGYDSDIWRVTAGADYNFTERIVAGLAFDFYNHNGDFDNGGDFNNNSYGFLAFGSFLPLDQVFVQLSAGYARKYYDRGRITTFTQLNSVGSVFWSTSGLENADYSADEARVSALTGYDYPIGNVTISPRAGLDFFHIDFETYSEAGISGLELTFHDDEQTSLQTRVGVQGSLVFQTGFGGIVPQASFDWKHEFEDDQRDVEVSFFGDTRAKRFTYQTDEPDRDWFEINAGVVAVLPHGLQVLDNYYTLVELQVFGNYRSVVEHKFFNSHAGTIGIRVTF